MVSGSWPITNRPQVNNLPHIAKKHGSTTDSYFTGSMMVCGELPTVCAGDVLPPIAIAIGWLPALSPEGTYTLT